jgi:pimeloyl-ACP methyl ester carboxylesterase
VLRCHLASKDASNLSKFEKQTRLHFSNIVYSIWSHRPISTDTKRKNVLVHFPPGPYSDGLSHNRSGEAAGLDDTPFDAFVTVKHALAPALEWNPTVRFPTPIHEVGRGLDYLTSSSSPFNERCGEPPRIALTGSHIGGALALVLALTEPNVVHSVAVIEPMVDWVGLDEVQELLQALKGNNEHAQRKQLKAMLSRFGTDTGAVLAATRSLIELRSRLFSTPSAFFDPFASPALFLRAPGRDTPFSNNIAEPLNYGNVESFGPYRDEWHLSDAELPDVPTLPQSKPLEGPVVEAMSATVPLPPRRRKVLRRWPAIGLPESVRLPLVKIFVQSAAQDLSKDETRSEPDIQEGHAALMRVQGSEMVDLMRRACFIGREKSFAETRVQIEHVANTEVDEHMSMQLKVFEWLQGIYADDDDTASNDAR